MDGRDGDEPILDWVKRAARPVRRERQLRIWQAWSGVFAAMVMVCWADDRAATSGAHRWASWWDGRRGRDAWFDEPPRDWL